MSHRHSIQRLDPEGFTGEQFNSWAKANSIGHHVPRIPEAFPIFIVDGLWIRALTMPLKSWPHGPGVDYQDQPGKWTEVRFIDGGWDTSRFRCRWYFLRTRPEDHGYVDPTDDTTEEVT